jgi:hypothetical protein
MKVIKNLEIEIPWTNTHYFELDQLSEENSDTCLYYGYSFLENGIDQNMLKNFKKNIYFNVTAPTEFLSTQDYNADNCFNEVVTICPYSNSWLNEIKKTDRYKTVCYPFNEKYIPKNTEKIYDVIYHGGIHGQMYIECLEILRNFNYRYSSLSWGINHLTQQYLKYATNLDLDNNQKNYLISQCKISVCYNTFTIRDSSYPDLNNIKSRPMWWKNEAFAYAETLRIAPQFKSRFNEAAMSKTLNLLKRDQWNVVENWYTPNEDFIYFDSNEELKTKIEDILNNFGKYEKIIDNAYNKCLKYTCQNMYQKIKTSNYV